MEISTNLKESQSISTKIRIKGAPKHFKLLNALCVREGTIEFAGVRPEAVDSQDTLFSRICV